MYDPDGDYADERRTSAASDGQDGADRPDGRVSFCPNCGCPLTVYTWQPIEGLAFCTTCIDDCPADCLSVFTCLGGENWRSILIDRLGVLWLSPSDAKYANTSLPAIAQRFAFERQYGAASGAVHEL